MSVLTPDLQRRFKHKGTYCIQPPSRGSVFTTTNAPMSMSVSSHAEPPPPELEARPPVGNLYFWPDRHIRRRPELVPEPEQLAEWLGLWRWCNDECENAYEYYKFWGTLTDEECHVSTPRTAQQAPG